MVPCTTVPFFSSIVTVSLWSFIRNLHVTFKSSHYLTSFILFYREYIEALDGWMPKVTPQGLRICDWLNSRQAILIFWTATAVRSFSSLAYSIFTRWYSLSAFIFPVALFLMTYWVCKFSNQCSSTGAHVLKTNVHLWEASIFGTSSKIMHHHSWWSKHELNGTFR